MHQTHGKFAQISTDTIVLQAVHNLKVVSCNPVDKPDRPMMTNLQIATFRTHSAAGGSHGSLDRRIRAFLNGEGHGEDVLGALYGHIADEPVPERLRALLGN
jgi:hypothetical protein